MGMFSRSKAPAAVAQSATDLVDGRIATLVDTANENARAANGRMTATLIRELVAPLSLDEAVNRATRRLAAAGHVAEDAYPSDMRSRLLRIDLGVPRGDAAGVTYRGEDFQKTVDTMRSDFEASNWGSVHSTWTKDRRTATASHMHSATWFWYNSLGALAGVKGGMLPHDPSIPGAVQAALDSCDHAAADQVAACEELAGLMSRPDS